MRKFTRKGSDLYQMHFCMAQKGQKQLSDPDSGKLHKSLNSQNTLSFLLLLLFLAGSSFSLLEFDENLLIGDYIIHFYVQPFHDAVHR